MSNTKNDEPDYIRSITRKQCIGCGRIGVSVHDIGHEEYCPEMSEREDSP